MNELKLKEKAIKHFLEKAVDNECIAFMGQGGLEDKDRANIKNHFRTGEQLTLLVGYHGRVNLEMLTENWAVIPACVDYEKAIIQQDDPLFVPIGNGYWYEHHFKDGSVFCFEGCDNTPIIGHAKDNMKVHNN